MRYLKYSPFICNLCALLFLLSFFSIQTSCEKDDNFKADSLYKTTYVNTNDIKICKWKDGAAACINFSFDDNNRSHKKISQILDEYGYKATFFVIPSYMYTDSLASMVKNGHEIGNHTYSHPDLSTLDSAKIDYQIRKGKELIEGKLGVKCVSFAEPGHRKNELSARIAFKYHLFIRNYSEYPEIGEHPRIHYTGMTLNKLNTAIQNAIKSGSILQIAGHGMDGEGYEPVTESFFRQTLDLVKEHQVKGNIWIIPVREGIQYEDLYHELSLEKFLHKDTLMLNFKKYNPDKYKDLDSCYISVEVPYNICNNISCTSEFIKIKKLTDRYIVNLDLKKSTNLTVILNGYPK